MPLYEFHCDKCDQDFEQLMRSDDKPACPGCGTNKVDKLFSVPAAHSGGTSTDLPIAGVGGGCGRPQCGTGGCQGLGGM